MPFLASSGIAAEEFFANLLTSFALSLRPRPNALVVLLLSDKHARDYQLQVYRDLYSFSCLAYACYSALTAPYEVILISLVYRACLCATELDDIAFGKSCLIQRGFCKFRFKAPDFYSIVLSAADK